MSSAGCRRYELAASLRQALPSSKPARAEVFDFLARHPRALLPGGEPG